MLLCLIVSKILQFVNFNDLPKMHVCHANGRIKYKSPVGNTSISRLGVFNPIYTHLFWSIDNLDVFLRRTLHVMLAKYIPCIC